MEQLTISRSGMKHLKLYSLSFAVGWFVLSSLTKEYQKGLNIFFYKEQLHLIFEIEIQCISFFSLVLFYLKAKSAAGCLLCLTCVNEEGVFVEHTNYFFA